jgi:hypothetical protein
MTDREFALLRQAGKAIGLISDVQQAVVSLLTVLADEQKLLEEVLRVLAPESSGMSGIRQRAGARGTAPGVLPGAAEKAGERPGAAPGASAGPAATVGPKSPVICCFGCGKEFHRSHNRQTYCRGAADPDCPSARLGPLKGGNGGRPWNPPESRRVDYSGE